MMQLYSFENKVHYALRRETWTWWQFFNFNTYLI